MVACTDNVMITSLTPYAVVVRVFLLLGRSCRRRAVAVVTCCRHFSYRGFYGDEDFELGRAALIHDGVQQILSIIISIVLRLVLEPPFLAQSLH
jgi:hypothetical protein